MVLPLPSAGTATRDVSRSEGNPRSGDSVHVKDVEQPMAEESGKTMTSAKCTSDGSYTLRRLWNNAHTQPGSTSIDIRQSGERLLKGLIVDYLTHERFPNTVGTLLGHARYGASAERGKGKAREEEEGEDDVMMSSVTLPKRSTDHRTRAHAEALVEQIERRKGATLPHSA